MSAPSPNVVEELRDHVLRLELARVEKKNALTPDMYRALADALQRADDDAEIRAVLLHGRPDCFCAGNDIEDLSAWGSWSGSRPAATTLGRR